MRYIRFSILTAAFFGGFFLSFVSSSEGRPAFSFVPRMGTIIFAEEDDDDEGDDGNDDNTSGGGGIAPTTTKTVWQTVTRQVTTYETRLVSDTSYLTDTDADGLVDAIDPEPNRDQREYFTDIDGDGVPNAFDEHHDEDDFAYLDDEDLNNNGILDAYEQ